MTITPDEFAGKLRASDRTKQIYAGEVRRFLKWLADRELTDEAAQEYIDHLEEKGKSPNTIATTANALRAYFKTMRRALDLDAPNIQIGTPKYLEMTEFYRLLEAADGPYTKTLISLLFDTGARIGEIHGNPPDGGLRRQDIDWVRGFLRLRRKGGYEADVVASQSLPYLKQYIHGRKKWRNDRVFGELTYEDARKALKRVAKAAGIRDFTPHMLRHTRAVQMLDAGCEIWEVQQALGHKSITVTMNIYGRLRPAQLRTRMEKAKW